MSLFNGFFWQDPTATAEDRIVTGSASVPVADIRSVQILKQESFSDGLYLPQRLKVIVTEGPDPSLCGEEARSFLEQLEKRDSRYERMVTRWDLGLEHS